MFYKKLERIYLENDISVRQVATKIALSPQSALGWKNGSQPSPATIKKLAEYFNVNIEYFLDSVNTADHGSIAFSDSNNNFFTQTQEHPQLGEIEEEILSLCKKMSIKQKMELLQTAYSILEK